MSYAAQGRSSNKCEAYLAQGESGVFAAQPVTQVGQLRWVEGTAQAWVTGYSMKPETFGQLLRRAREDAHLSQEALAEKVGLSRKTVQTIEAAKGRPKIKDEVAVGTKMAQVCKVRVGELSSVLGWVPIEEAEGTGWEAGLDDDEKRAVSHIADLFRAKAEDPPAERSSSPGVARQQRAARS